MHQRNHRKRNVWFAVTVCSMMIVGAVIWGWEREAAPYAEPDSRSPSGYSLSIDLNQPGAKISSTLYGALYEEINHAGDGGIYGELISNRSFEDHSDDPVNWWKDEHGGSKGSIGLTGQNLLNDVQNRALELTVWEAAFMTGMERNSDVVVMSSYAPLFVHDQDRTWNLRH